jgi:hypothetical protein
MEIPKSVQKLNERIGACLGRNPQGEPLYKWVYSEDYFHWMRDITGYQEVFHAFDPEQDRLHLAADNLALAKYHKAYDEWDADSEAPMPEKPTLQRKGFITMEPVYKRRKMMPQYEDTWLIAHWHEADPEHAWRIKYGSDALWPREGYWTPVNAWQERGQLPDDSLTDKIIELVSKYRVISGQQIYDEAESAVNAQERDLDNLRKDILDDACTAFGATPGSRSGGVSFPQPGVNYAVQE